MATNNISPVKLLLSRNISISQSAAYIGALFTGALILLLGIGFLADFTLGSGNAVERTGHFMVVSKKVAPTGLFGGEAPEFTSDEISAIGNLQGVKRTGIFKRADFDVYARLDPSMGNMSTALFLESVPDGFMDVATSRFRFDPADPHAEVPVIIPKDYLSLYNFGFAPSRGLPAITPEVLGVVPIELSVSGHGSQQLFKARVVGCSERINTIAVPEAFIDYANSRFGREATTPLPSRIIVETEPGTDLSDYLAGHGMETAAGMLSDSRVARTVAVASSVVMAIGALIMVLAVFIVTVSLHLLLYKNRSTLHGLMLLGYSPAQVCRPYMIRSVTTNAVVTVAAVAAALLLRTIWLPTAQSLGAPCTGAMWLLAAALLLILLITSINAATIASNVRSAFRQKG